MQSRVNASQERIAPDAAWELLKHAESIFVAKGRKALEFSLTEENKAQILAAVIGPSGNLRAPTWKIERCFVVGFHREIYEKVFCGKN